MRPFPVLAAAALVAAGPAVARPADTCGAERFPHGAWVTVDPPPFPAGPATVADHAVAPGDPERLYVTNGLSLLVSRDGGCRWSGPAPLPDVPGVTPRVEALAVAATDPDVAYAALGGAVASRPGVLRTTDGGATWRQASGGLEMVQGRPLQLVVAPGDAEVAYLVVEGNRVSQGDTAAEVARSLYATEDGGATWAQRDAAPLLVEGSQSVGPVRVGGNGSFEGVAVDPLDPYVVWLYGGFGLWRSADGARTSGEVVPGRPELGGGAIGHVDLFHAGDLSRVLAFGSSRPVAFASFDGGRRFSTLGTSGIVRSSATGRRFAEIAIATDTNVLYQRDAASGTRRITPPGPSVRDLQAGHGRTPVFYARTTAAVLRWTAPPDPPLRPGERPAPLPPDPATVSLPRLPALPVPSLTGPAEVPLAAGRSATVPYTLDLPGVQRADVYFLVDVSASMAQEIDGLRSALAGIVTDLVAANVDAWFGVGRFNTYDGEPYFRVTPAVPPGPRLAQALDVLVASGGGERKSHLEAVYQSATGAGGSAGYPATPLGPGGSYWIPPGQAAGFRPEAPVRLVLTITDEPFYEQAPSPSYAKVGASLRANGVRQIGLALDDGDVLPGLGAGPEAGLRRLAVESGALAPPGGVDCDGDAAPDVAAGEPLVCVMPSARSGEATVLANAIVNLVRSLPNRGAVDFAVEGGPPARLSPGSLPVEFERSLRRSVDVTYTCPADLAEETGFRYDVTASAGGAPLATAATVLRCAPAALGAVARPAPPVAAGGVPPAPQAPAGNTNANPNPNANPQSQPQSQANPGAVAEPEREQQVAAAGAEIRDDRAEEPAVGWYAGALAASAGAALGLRSRAARGAAPAARDR